MKLHTDKKVFEQAVEAAAQYCGVFRHICAICRLVVVYYNCAPSRTNLPETSYAESKAFYNPTYTHILCFTVKCVLLRLATGTCGDNRKRLLCNAVVKKDSAIRAATYFCRKLRVLKF